MAGVEDLGLDFDIVEVGTFGKVAIVPKSDDQIVFPKKTVRLYINI